MGVPAGYTAATRTSYYRGLQQSVVRLLRLRQVGPLALAGAAIVGAVIILGVFAPYIAPYSPLKQQPFSSLQAPSLAHPLGLDDLGRDVLSRIVFGSRVSLQVGVVAVAVALAVGVPLGLVSGYWGGVVDTIIMRVMDGILAFPALVLALTITAVLGPSLTNMMIAIGIVYVPSYARVVRGQVLSLRERLYVDAARAVGAGDMRIIWRHILPNSVAPVVVLASISIAGAILAEAGLSFLGLGVQPPTPAWGSMVSTGMRYLAVAPWMWLGPGAALFVTVMGFNLLGDGLRDALDPRLRR